MSSDVVAGGGGQGGTGRGTFQITEAGTACGNGLMQAVFGHPTR